LGTYLAGGQSILITKPALLAVPIVWLIVAGNNVVNDLCDIQVDRIQKPHRVLPSGRLGISKASILASLLFISGLILASVISTPSFMIALAASILGIVYSFYLKSSVLLGNAVVGLLSGLSVIYGAVVISRIDNRVLLAAGFVFVFVFIREILKTIADLDGDSQLGVTTIATRIGSRDTFDLFTCLAAIFVVITALPWFVKYAPNRYLLAIFLGIYIPLISATGLLWIRFNQVNLRLALRLTKLAWFLGLFALSYLR